MNAAQHDLVIVGGGMVGASLAIALAGRGLRLAMIEAHPPAAADQPGYDDRAIALAFGTRRIFDAIGVWPQLDPLVEPIRTIHISDRGHFGFTRLHAEQEGVPALGYVITARELGRVLLDRLQQDPGLELIAPARLVAFSDRGDHVEVEIERGGVMQTLRTRLLVGADGGNSSVREQLGLPVQRWEYDQSAVVTNITPSKAHAQRAFERFTASGPVALLPMTEGRCAVVWTVHNEQLDAVLALDDDAFLAAFQQRFGYRLGRFLQVGRRQAYPLGLLRVRESVRGRVVIIGNAAHTLHPIAGQGFNLGIRDVAALVEVVEQAARAGADVGGGEVLAAYERFRLGEQRNVALATDVLARLFSNPLAPLRLGRNLGLLALDCLPGAKRPLARAAMGLAGHQSALARGVPLASE